MTIGSHRTRAATVPQKLVAAVAPSLADAAITPEYRRSGMRGRRWAIEHRRPTAVLVERPASGSPPGSGRSADAELRERTPPSGPAPRAEPALRERIPPSGPTVGADPAPRAEPALRERIPIPDPTRRWVVLLAAAALLAQVGAAFIRRRSAQRRSARAAEHATPIRRPRG